MRARFAAALWALMMLVWLGALVFGAAQMLPLAAATPGMELVAAAMWLIIGAAAWAVALGLGLRRFRR